MSAATDNAAGGAEGIVNLAPEPKSVLYCPHCTFPPEYCSFGSSASKCRAWLVDEHPELAEKIYGSGPTSGDAGATDGAAGGDAKPGKGAKKDAADVEGTATQLEEGLTLKQKEDEDKEREKKERREERKKEKEEKERKVGWERLDVVH